MPTWRQGQAVGEWRQIGGTALESVPITVSVSGYTGPSSKVDAWSGFSIDTRTSSVYAVANGGHHDYAGNEVDRIDLLANAPAWTEIRSSTPMTQVVEDQPYYNDGRPTSRHTYYGTIINERTNRAMLINGSQYGNGYGISNVDGFNLSSRDWDAGGTYAKTPTTVTQVMGAAMAMDKATGDVYAFGWSSMSKYTAASNSWSSKDTAFNGQSAASAVDTRRNRILLVGGPNNIRAIYDIATGTMQAVTLGGSYGSTVGGQSDCMVYDPLQDAFLYRKDAAGAEVFRINASTLSVDMQPTSSAGTRIPLAPQGVWSRFMYVPALKGVAYAPVYNGGMWFLRTN